jgi:hypothetical protein
VTPDGFPAKSGREFYCYLYGAVHAIRMDKETWELVEQQMSYLLWRRQTKPISSAAPS